MMVEFNFMFPFSVVVIPDVFQVTLAYNKKMIESINSDNDIPNALTIDLLDSLKKLLLVHTNIEKSAHSLDYSNFSVLLLTLELSED